MIEICRTKTGLVEYRSEGAGPVILVLNGGHTNCRSPFEQEKFLLERGFRLVIPSRPGYGKTPSSSGKSAEEFACTLSFLMDELSIDKAIVIGISAAGRTALHFAKDYPQRVSKLILQSAVTCEPWPDSMTKRGASLLFNRYSERWTWSALRLLGRFAPDLLLKFFLPSLSSLKPIDVINSWSEEERHDVLAFLLNLRSGEGFLNDVKHTFDDFSRIATPTLLIASINDKSVSPANSIKAAQQLANAELLLIPAQSHDKVSYFSHN